MLFLLFVFYFYGAICVITGSLYAHACRRKDEQNYHQKRDRHSTKPKASEYFGEAINSECQLIRRGFLITPVIVFINWSKVFSSGRSTLPSCEEFNRMSFLLSFQGVVFAPHLDNRDLALSISKRFSHSISHPTAKQLGVRNWNQTAKHADSNSLWRKEPNHGARRTRPKAGLGIGYTNRHGLSLSPV